jgi:hypothetical protein
VASKVAGADVVIAPPVPTPSIAPASIADALHASLQQRRERAA